ncbi:hypothetical protein [Symmachiella dynata]|uniref:hypothetical protein n=1 Tax=Symmachiella dynata TaxID=2527995 RepID=UPI0030EBB042
MKTTVQILSLGLVGAAAVMVAVLAHWTGQSVILSVIGGVVVVYVALLVRVFLGNEGDWDLRLAKWVWNLLFERWKPLAATFFILASFAVLLGFWLHDEFYIPIRIVFNEKGNPINEEVTVVIESADGRKETHTTRTSEISFHLTRLDRSDRTVIASTVKHAKSNRTDVIAPVTRIELIPLVAPIDLAIRWELVTNNSSLVGSQSDGVLSVEPNPKIGFDPTSGDGDSERDPQFHPRIIKWLQERSEELGKTQYLPFLADDANLLLLTFEQARVIKTLRPTPREYRGLPETEQETVDRWLSHYVGQWAPRIRFTVDNTRNSDNVQIIAVIYDVEKVDVFAHDIPFPQTKEFDFELAFKKGKQRFPLASKGKEVSVSGGRAATFDVIFRAGKDAPVSPIWDGMVSLVTNRGTFKVGRLHLETYNPHQGGIKAK